MPDNWTEGDAATLNEFLNRPVGIRFMIELTQRTPRLGGRTLEDTALQSKLVEGHLEKLEQMQSLATFKESPHQRGNDYVDIRSNRPTPKP